MALSCHVDLIAPRSGDAAATTYTVTTGFQTKAGIVFGTGRDIIAGEGAGGASHRTTIGFFTSSTNRGSTGYRSVDATAAGSGSEWLRGDAVAAWYNPDATTVEGLLDVDSITSTTVVFILDDPFASNTTFVCICFGGDAITNATVVEIDFGTGTGTIDYTTVGFQGTVLFIAGTNELGPSNVADAAGAQMWFGACTGTGDEHVWWGGMDQGSATMDTGAYCLPGEIWYDVSGAINAPSAGQNRAEFSAWLSNGFRLNKLIAGRSGVNAFAMVIQGGSWKVGNFTTRNTTGTISLSSFGFVPTGILVVSALRAQSTSPNNTEDDQLSIGATASDDLADGYACAHVDDDGVADAEVATGMRNPQLYQNVDVADTEVGLIEVQSFDTDGITLNQSDADPSANFCFYVACGEVAQGFAFPFPRGDARIVPQI